MWNDNYWNANYWEDNYWIEGEASGTPADDDLFGNIGGLIFSPFSRLITDIIT